MLFDFIIKKQMMEVIIHDSIRADEQQPLTTKKPYLAIHYSQGLKSYLFMDQYRFQFKDIP